jgi:hypothetical protein
LVDLPPPIGKITMAKKKRYKSMDLGCMKRIDERKRVIEIEIS